MKLILPSIPTIVMTTHWHRRRQACVAAMLCRLGFAGVRYNYAVRSDPYWRNLTGEFFRVLGETACPFLILEDDAMLAAENYRAEIDPPDDTDVLYLGGFSNVEPYAGDEPGLLRRGGGVGLVYREVDAMYVRIYNMHSTHAVLFLNPAAAAGFREAIGRYPDTPADVCFSREMGRWKTLLVKRPFWYQNDGHNNRKTQDYFEPRRFAAAPPGGRIRAGIRDGM